MTDALGYTLVGVGVVLLIGWWGVAVRVGLLICAAINALLAVLCLVTGEPASPWYTPAQLAGLCLWLASRA